jgi:hypothetical protein
MIRFFLGCIFMMGVCFSWIHYRFAPQQTLFEVELMKCRADQEQMVLQYASIIAEVANVYHN